MPTYEYQCQQGHTFEVEQKITDKPLDTCPECIPDIPCKRLIAPCTNFILVGPRWARDRYQ